MIQRIQTVYFIINIILLLICICSNIGTLIDSEQNISVVSNLSIVTNDTFTSYKPWCMFALLLIATIVTLVTIFLYKKRMLQIRITVFNSLVLIGYYALVGIFITSIPSDYTFTPSWVLCLPFVCIVLNWLAIRGIGKDEMLVKAYERLR